MPNNHFKWVELHSGAGAQKYVGRKLSDEINYVFRINFYYKKWLFGTSRLLLQLGDGINVFFLPYMQLNKRNRNDDTGTQGKKKLVPVYSIGILNYC